MELALGCACATPKENGFTAPTAPPASLAGALFKKLNPVVVPPDVGGVALKEKGCAVGAVVVDFTKLNPLNGAEDALDVDVVVVLLLLAAVGADDVLLAGKAEAESVLLLPCFFSISPRCFL